MLTRELRLCREGWGLIHAGSFGAFKKTTLPDGDTQTVSYRKTPEAGYEMGPAGIESESRLSGYNGRWKT